MRDEDKVKRLTPARQEVGFTFEIRVLSGEEGKQLRFEQECAAGAFLMWMREHRRVSMAARDNVETGPERRPRNQSA